MKTLAQVIKDKKDRYRGDLALARRRVTVSQSEGNSHTYNIRLGLNKDVRDFRLAHMDAIFLIHLAGDHGSIPRLHSNQWISARLKSLQQRRFIRVTCAPNGEEPPPYPTSTYAYNFQEYDLWWRTIASKNMYKISELGYLVSSNLYGFMDYKNACNSLVSQCDWYDTTAVGYSYDFWSQLFHELMDQGFFVDVLGVNDRNVRLSITPKTGSYWLYNRGMREDLIVKIFARCEREESRRAENGTSL